MKLKIVTSVEKLDDAYNSGEEQRFKTNMLHAKKLIHPGRTYIEVENEEKEPGFPDTLEVFENQKVRFVEYKVSDEDGRIEFRRDQIRWYKLHENLDIWIIAWSVPDSTYYSFPARYVLELKSELVKRNLRLYVKGGHIY